MLTLCIINDWNVFSLPLYPDQLYGPSNLLPPMHFVLWVLSLRMKWPDCEADHSYASGAELLYSIIRVCVCSAMYLYGVCLN